MNPFEFVLAILLMVFVFSIVRHKMGIPVRSMREMRGDAPADTAESARLREEVRELKERIKVLERITVEKENSLAKEIESLRDR
jgi:cell division protein FtsB